jgi:hypothetical protein
VESTDAPGGRIKADYDKFITQYLIDYDPFGAAMRVGYSVDLAEAYAAKCMACPYVVLGISDVEHAMGGISDAEKHRARIIAGLYREANNHRKGSTQAARVAALSRLSAIFALDAAARDDIAAAEADATIEVSFVAP